MLLCIHKVGVATKKSLVPIFILTLGTKSALELVDRSCLGCLASVSNDCKYDVSFVSATWSATAPA